MQPIGSKWIKVNLKKKIVHVTWFRPNKLDKLTYNLTFTKGVYHAKANRFISKVSSTRYYCPGSEFYIVGQVSDAVHGHYWVF